jgi:hypothetical protein
MPYNSQGQYVLPLGQPVQDGQTILTNTFNVLTSDIAGAFNNTLTRDGAGVPISPFKLVDGTVNGPGLAWNSEASTGFYHPATGSLAVAVSGANVVTFKPARVLVNGAADDGSNILQVAGGIMSSTGISAPTVSSGGNVNLNFLTNGINRGYISAAGDFIFGIGTATVGATRALQIANLDSTNAASHAKLYISTLGSTGGDPSIIFDTQTVFDWSLGADTSASSSFKLSGSAALGSNDFIIVNTAGQVCIGAAGPLSTALLAVRGGAGTAQVAITAATAQVASIELAGNGTGVGSTSFLLAMDGAGSAIVSNRGAAPMVFGTANAERGRIAATGEWSLGTSTFGGYKLAVGGTILSVGGEVSPVGYGVRVLNNAQNGGGYLQAPTGNNGGLLISADAGALSVWTGGVGHYNFTAGGDLYVNAPSAFLSVGTNNRGSGQVFAYQAAGNASFEAGTAAASTSFGTNASGATNAWGAPNGVGYFGSPTNMPIVITSGGAERMRFTSNGYVGIGNPTPSAMLNVTIPGVGSVALLNGGSGDHYFDGTSFIVRTSPGVEVLHVGTAAGTVNIVQGTGKLLIGGLAPNWASTGTAIPNSALHQISIPHPYGRSPDMFKIVIRCLTSELGYAVNTEVDIASGVESGASGLSVYGYTTAIGYIQSLTGPNTIPIRNATNGALAWVTAANWTLIARGLWF